MQKHALAHFFHHNNLYEIKKNIWHYVYVAILADTGSNAILERKSK